MYVVCCVPTVLKDLVKVMFSSAAEQHATACGLFTDSKTILMNLASTLENIARLKPRVSIIYDKGPATSEISYSPNRNQARNLRNLLWNLE